MTLRHITILSLILHAGISYAAGSQCYYLNGTATDDTYKPCFPEKANSGCCVLAKPNDAPNDICLDNGLCYSQDTGASGYIFQDACTDGTWGSADCPRYCNSLKAVGTGYYILPCPARGGGQWCCSQSGEDCCDSASSVSMPPLPTSTSTSTSSSSTSPATNSAVPTSDTGSGESDSKATSVGVGVGVALGACLLATIAGLIFQHVMHKRRVQGLTEELARQMARPEPIPYSQTFAMQPPSEVENTQKPSVFELGARQS